MSEFNVLCDFIRQFEGEEEEGEKNELQGVLRRNGFEQEIYFACQCRTCTFLKSGNRNYIHSDKDCFLLFSCNGGTPKIGKKRKGSAL